MDNLENLISTFLRSKEKGLQLDFHKENEEVLVQLFKQKDMKNWELKFDLANPNDGYCFFIFFNKYKTKNEINLENFKNSKYFDSYIFSTSQGNDTYYKMDDVLSASHIKKHCLNIIEEIYNYDGLIKYRLNAY